MRSRLPKHKLHLPVQGKDRVREGPRYHLHSAPAAATAKISRSKNSILIQKLRTLDWFDLSFFVMGETCQDSEVKFVAKRKLRNALTLSIPPAGQMVHFEFKAIEFLRLASSEKMPRYTELFPVIL